MGWFESVALVLAVIYTRLMGAVESRWAPRASNPLRGINNVLGGFDPHPLPPFMFC